MKRILTYLTVTALACACIFIGLRGLTQGAATALADGETSGAVPIYTAEDMKKIAADPTGSYALMCDIDMGGVEWPAITFTGQLNGNNHAILNLNTVAVSEETRVTYDGNRKTYDTHFAGLFAIAENASITGVRLVGIDMMHTFDGDCFLGGIAGFASGTTIENCEVTGSIRLDVDNGRMFGVGGVIGYGNAVIRNCTINITLVNTDLDKKNRDEQYLGGICGAGYPDIEGCTIDIAGFISDHGYVHSGGMVGMYIIYPKRFDRDGFVKNNALKGFITFFEDNTNRRAYCVKDFGEVMDHKFKESGNTFDFKRDERKDYSVNLLPHMCDAPECSDLVVAATAEEPGYTEHTCKTCGYVYRDAYTLPSHTLSETCEVVTEATVETPGLGEYTCRICGARVQKEIPCLTPTPVPTATPTPTPEPDKNSGNASDGTAKSDKDSSSKGSTFGKIIAIILSAGGGILLACVVVHFMNENKRKKKKRSSHRR